MDRLSCSHEYIPADRPYASAALVNCAIVPLHLLPRGPRASASGGAACGEAAAVGEVVGRTVADLVGCVLGAL